MITLSHRFALHTMAAFLALLAGSAMAQGDQPGTGPYDAAIAHYHAGDLGAAFEALLPLAEGGDARAQSQIAAMYFHGEGTQADPAQAMRWFRAAAKGGDAIAQINLSTLLREDGEHDEALRWLHAAAEKQHPEALHMLGYLHDQGEGVEKDQAAAAQWYEAAAGLGHVLSQFNLGLLYVSGSGVPRDDEFAAYWFRSAAGQGHVPSQINLGTLYSSGEGVPLDHQEAYLWYSLAAAAGSEIGAENRDVTRSHLSTAQRDAARARAALMWNGPGAALNDLGLPWLP